MAVTDKYQLEDGSGNYQLEDGSGAYLLEVPAAIGAAQVHPRGTVSGLSLVYYAGPVRALPRASGLTRTKLYCVGRASVLPAAHASGISHLATAGLARLGFARGRGLSGFRLASAGTARSTGGVAVARSSDIDAVGTARSFGLRAYAGALVRIAVTGRARVSVARGYGEARIRLQNEHAINGSCTITVTANAQMFFDNFHAPAPSGPGGGGWDYPAARRLPDHLVRPWRRPKKHAAHRLTGSTAVAAPVPAARLQYSRHFRCAGLAEECGALPWLRVEGRCTWMPDEGGEALLAFTLLTQQ